MKHFPIALLCCIIWHIMRSMADSDGCPSNKFQRCASHDETCTIPSDIKQGYLLYGNIIYPNPISKWSFMPFTNTRGLDLEIECNDYLGSPTDIGSKQCCFIELNTGINATDYDGYIREGSGWTHYQLMTQRFGKNNQYIYRVINNAYGDCYYKSFGDITPGALKECNYKNGAELSPPGVWTEGKWQVCATEVGLCTGLSTTALNWIRYGTDQKYYYRLVLSNDGTIVCNDLLFQGSPISKTKTCWRAHESPHFHGITGQWERATHHCTGCSSTMYEIEATVETSSTIERTEEWSISLQVSASAGFSFVGAEMTSTVSTTVTESTLTSRTLTSTKAETITRECTKPYYYQFVTGADQFDGISENSFTVYSGSTFCSTSVKLPKCPPPYCLYDDNDPALQDCQNCTEQYYVDSNHSSPLMDSIRPPSVYNMTFNITDITVITTGADDYVLRHLPNSWMIVLVSCSFVYYV